MIAIDLSPLAFAPRRGVARALLHLLEGLKRVERDGLRIRRYLPNVDASRMGLLPGMLGRVHVVGPPDPSPRAWRKELAKHIEQDDAKVLLSPWAACPKTRVPIVAWIHEAPWVGRGALEGHARTLRHRAALTRAVARAAALVTPSEAVRRDLLEAHPETRERCYVVPHGHVPRTVTTVESEHGLPEVLHGFRTLSANVQTELHSASMWYVTGGEKAPMPRAPYALLLGTGRGAAGPWKKGVDVFLDAFRDERLATLTPVLVGEPGLPLGPHPAHPVVVAEPDDLEVADLVAKARVLVVPSRSEGFGYPVLEGFSAGIPVVASAAGALPEVGGGAARLVPPGNVDGLVDAILRVHTDEALRARLIKAGHRRALEFPVEAMAAGWLRVLTKAGGIPWHG